jgi:hypothetical protein
VLDIRGSGFPDQLRRELETAWRTAVFDTAVDEKRVSLVVGPGPPATVRVIRFTGNQLSELVVEGAVAWSADQVAAVAGVTAGAVYTAGLAEVVRTYWSRIVAPDSTRSAFASNRRSARRLPVDAP